jgi:hypothetical protein
MEETEFNNLSKFKACVLSKVIYRKVDLYVQEIITLLRELNLQKWLEDILSALFGIRSQSFDSEVRHFLFPAMTEGLICVCKYKYC